MTLSSADRYRDLANKARTLVDAVNFDNNGRMVGNVFMGGNGGLISRETIKAADDLEKALQAEPMFAGMAGKGA